MALRIEERDAQGNHLAALHVGRQGLDLRLRPLALHGGEDSARAEKVAARGDESTQLGKRARADQRKTLAWLPTFDASSMNAAFPRVQPNPGWPQKAALLRPGSNHRHRQPGPSNAQGSS